MRFEDRSITNLSEKDTVGFHRAIVELLCGETNPHPQSTEDEVLFLTLLKRASEKGINWAQFNELLLLLDQPRVTKGFFDFFFEKPIIKLDGLKKGIVKFRGYAMLSFGNFRYAFKNLISKDIKEIEALLVPYSEEPSKLKSQFESRPEQAIPIDQLPKDQTWYVGYISSAKFKKESGFLEELSSEQADSHNGMSRRDVKTVFQLLEEIGSNIEKAEEKALRNTDIYLTWDYMDVYVATSMRNRWEYEETSEFISNVFSDKTLARLKLRYFDPTQSKCENRLDKGLIEGLMLKRARCTIYMAQEYDTMGKDSELAATLAQRKPVIAYVPRIDISNHVKRLQDYPLEFFERRFPILRAEGLMTDEDCASTLYDEDPDFDTSIEDFLEDYSKYRSSQPFALWVDKDEEFKQGHTLFARICKLLAIAEHYSFEKRAKTLIDIHPLAVQVHLESGVANGVLVVRDHKECKKVLRHVLLNEMAFRFTEVDEGHGATLLTESITSCPYRVVTRYEKLVNSFWSHYFTPS